MYQVLSLLRDEGPMSRTELADRLDLSRPRLGVEIGRMTAAGKVRQTGPAPSHGGRRPALIELDPHIRFAAIDLGLTSIDVEITDGSLRPVASYSEPADAARGPRPMLTRVDEILASFKTDGVYERLSAIGIGMPARVRVHGGLPISPSLPVWDRYPLCESLGRQHGCPVAVDEGVRVMAIGERHAGVEGPVDNQLFVKIDTDIGCGIHVGGEVYRGPDGRAGDIGHIQVDPHGPVCSCGNTGCLAAVLSSLTAKDIARGAAEGDLTSINLIREGARRLGTVLAMLVNFLNPSMIVIGGGVAGLGTLMLAEIRGAVYRRSSPLATGNLPVVLSQLGPRAGVVGAAVLASEVAFGAPMVMQRPTPSGRSVPWNVDVVWGCADAVRS
ncbi:ROK family transcriptional regulator [Phytohabitans rumicis]|uniref:Sugar kinase n=1 Tax=Phytohabitans rumicis TaxID=1076125 RepID=A0A6V8KVG8_9ACTN|nr:ROK family transcriptional regulator [Phytohabitans rumicis]GFJ87824.1 sugar kinase [Phytohabitans rumicis]